MSSYPKSSIGISKGFVLLEFVIGVVVLGVVLIVSAKMLLNIQKDNVSNSSHLSFALKANNTLDSLRAYLLEARRDSIVYGKDFISWQSDLMDLKTSKDISNIPIKVPHRVFLQDGSLYLDGFLMIDGLSDFQILSYGNGFKLKICGKIQHKTLCKQRWISLFDV